MADFTFDPTVLPHVRETKGSVLLRSNHRQYNRAVLDSKWDEDREAQPMDYDIRTSEPGDKNLLKATYLRLGNLTDGSMKNNISTQHDSMKQVGELTDDHKTREVHKTLVTYDNFVSTNFDRDTGKPERGYGSVLPRHSPSYRKMNLITSHMTDYQYRLEWTPKSPKPPEPEDANQFRRPVSKFAGTDGPKRHGLNTFKDCDGTVNDYTVH